MTFPVALQTITTESRTVQSLVLGAGTSPMASYTHLLWVEMPPEAWSCKDQFSLYYVGIRRVNYSALLSSALATLLDLVLSQEQDPVVVCTDLIFVNILLKPGYEVLALLDTQQSFQYSWQHLN